MPTINLVIASSLDLGVGVKDLLHALRAYVREGLHPVWGVSCRLVLGPPGDGWEIYVVDDVTQASVLGFHDVGPDGVPRSFVSVSDCLRSGEPVSVCASHELAEMLVDPHCDRGVMSPRGRWVALEICDAVERETFAIGGMPVCDFLYPAWFGGSEGPFDHLGRCSAPWEILPGGYMPVWDVTGWAPLFGSREAEAGYAKEDRRLHRSERRNRRAGTRDAQDRQANTSIRLA